MSIFDIGRCQPITTRTTFFYHQFDIVEAFISKRTIYRAHTAILQIVQPEPKHNASHIFNYILRYCWLSAYKFVMQTRRTIWFAYLSSKSICIDRKWWRMCLADACPLIELCLLCLVFFFLVDENATDLSICNCVTTEPFQFRIGSTIFGHGFFWGPESCAWKYCNYT